MVSLLRWLGLANAGAPSEVSPVISIVGKPPVSVTLRDARDAILRGNAVNGCGGRLGDGAKPAIPESSLIDQGRRKAVCLTDAKVQRAVSEVTSAKGGIACISRESAGDACVPAAVADASKQLIALTESVVLANIEMIGVVGLTAVDGIVAQDAISSGCRIKFQELESVLIIAAQKATDSSDSSELQS